ncbi:MAG: protein translocase subunit SecF [Myxococcota bacterium]
MQLFRQEPNFNFVGSARFFGVVSFGFVVASIIGLFTVGLNLGIDFAGGYEIQVKFDEPVSETEIRNLVQPLGLGDARVQRFGSVDDNEYLILVREHGTITVATKKALRADFDRLAGGEEHILSWSVAESGENLQVTFDGPITKSQVREVVEGHGLEIKRIGKSERQDRPDFSVDLVSIADHIERALVAGLNVAEGTELVRRQEFVGPQVGAQLRNQGFLAIIYALLFILLYIAVRFDLFFSPGAVVALIHDVAITVGVFIVFQLEFNLPIVAAILALIGYSLNDTIVVYDRIRENTLRLRGRSLRAMVNTSINQTLSRTVLTSGTTLIVVGALLVFGGGIIRDFSIALCVGVIVGTYSSIWIASPVYILLRERSAGGSKSRSDASAAAA